MRPDDVPSTASERDPLLAPAKALLSAARDYFNAARKNGAPGAVRWVTDGEAVVIFTRGEYRETLMKNVTDVGETVHYFSTEEDDHE